MLCSGLNAGAHLGWAVSILRSNFRMYRDKKRRGARVLRGGKDCAGAHELHGKQHWGIVSYLSGDFQLSTSLK